MNKDPYDIFVFYQENQADTYWCYRFESSFLHLERCTYYRNSRSFIRREEYNLIANGVLYKHMSVPF